MKQKKLDRIVIATFCQSPIDLYLTLPLSIPKTKVLEKAKEFLRKENKKYFGRGYYRIVNHKIKKDFFDSYDLLNHPHIEVDYSYNKWINYYCWSIKIEIIYSGEKPSRRKVLKYNRGKNRRFRLFNKKIIETSINKTFREVLNE